MITSYTVTTKMPLPTVKHKGLSGALDPLNRSPDKATTDLVINAKSTLDYLNHVAQLLSSGYVLFAEQDGLQFTLVFKDGNVAEEFEARWGGAE